MKSDLYETWYDVGGGIKEAPNKNLGPIRARMHTQRACTFLYLVIVFKQCRIRWWWRKWKLLRRVQYLLTTIFTLLEWYVHECEHNAHKCACTFLYFSIAFKQCRICQLWRKWKLLRRAQFILTTIFALLEWCVHACKHNAHELACMFLYLSIAFKQSQILGKWWKLKCLRRVQSILTTIFTLLEWYVHECKYNAH